MEKFLTDLEVWVWTYPGDHRRFTGLHFSAKPSACDALLKCLELVSTEGGGHRTIPLRSLRPTDEAKVTGGMRFSDFKMLEIRLSEATVDLCQFSVSAVGDRATFDFTNESLFLLREGIEDVRRGEGDYTIAPDRKRPRGPKDKESLELSFWPCFGHVSVVP